MKKILFPSRLLRLMLLMLLPWLVGGVAACAFLPRLPWQGAPSHPLADQQPALRRAFWSELDTPVLQSAPRYTLRFTVDVSRQLITGTASITVTNRTESPWSDVALRLYPNLAHYGGGNSLASHYPSRLSNLERLLSSTSLRCCFPKRQPPWISATVFVIRATHGMAIGSSGNTRASLTSLWRILFWHFPNPMDPGS